jgi:hypothetical protein
MDNKYALGSTKVAKEHHDLMDKAKSGVACRFCGSHELVFCPTMEDHRCQACDAWQEDISKNYATGRSSEY